MGLTFEQGQRVVSLPFAEGVTLTTLLDDWRRVRLEPQLLTFGSRLTRAAGGIGTFVLFSLAAGILPLRLIFVDIETNVLAGARIVVQRTTGPPAVVTTGPITPLEAPTGATNVSAAVFQDHGALGAQFLNPLGFSLFQNGGFAPSGHGSWLPRLLLPGEHLFFQAPANTALDCTVAWEQLPTSTDVVTSQASRLSPVV